MAYGQDSADQASGDVVLPDATTVSFTLKAPVPVVVATRSGATGVFKLATPVAGKVTVAASATGDYGVAWRCPAAVTVIGPFTMIDVSQHLMEVNTKDVATGTITCAVTPTAGKTGALTFDVDARSIPGATAVQIQAVNGTYFKNTGEKLLATGTVQAPLGTDKVNILAYSNAGFTYLRGARAFTGQVVPGKLDGGVLVKLGAADKTIPEAITYKTIPTGFTAPLSSAIFTP